ncbi:hypothetical protein B4167_3675 [Caldibacillus thermoamylovorans]|uniref:Transposase n=1 Tax=Caldibacillus thermoamylovorans TaxID=35841 RepID=A0ABD4A372_9BACI|nr:hypothetical protein B4167_3675 [Caldibacillus thermoamylovorans]
MNIEYTTKIFAPEIDQNIVTQKYLKRLMDYNLANTWN